MADYLVPVCIFIMLSLLNYRIISACVSGSTKWPLFSLYYILLWILEVIICYWLLILEVDFGPSITAFLYGALFLMFYLFPATIAVAILLYLLAGLLRYLTYDRKIRQAGKAENDTDQ